MAQYIKENFIRNEILSFLKRDYGQYALSIRTLDRRLRHFYLFYSDNVTVEKVRDAVEQELERPGKLFGYRAMQANIRETHSLNVPRDLVHAMMFDIDPEDLEARAPGTKKAKPKGHFISKGTNWVHSLDGHDKPMGYQNSTFPLAIYGCIDRGSRKMLWLRVWVSNSDPLIVGRWYLEYLYETRVMSRHLRDCCASHYARFFTASPW